MNDQFKKATHGRYISIADYYRIALPSLLPTVDKIIYIDTDVINFKDLTEMYSLEFKDDIYLLGTLDKIFMLNELKKQFKNLTRYMNAGINIIPPPVENNPDIIPAIIPIIIFFHIIIIPFYSKIT